MITMEYSAATEEENTWMEHVKWNKSEEKDK